MISAEQIKGARAMLDWSQDTLAAEAGVSSATIYNLERGQVSFGSARKIRVALERKGFEFIGTKGLTRADETHTVLHGPDAPKRFFEATLATARKRGGELVAVFRTPDAFARSLGVEDDDDFARLDELRAQVSIRCLLSNAQQARRAVPLGNFRAIPHHPFDPLALVVCGNAYTIVTAAGRDISYFIITSAEIANGGRAEFEKHWQSAVPFGATDLPSLGPGESASEIVGNRKASLVQKISAAR